MSFSRSNKRRHLRVEGLEARQLLAADLAQACAEAPYLIGDSNLDGPFDESDLIAVFQAGKYETGEAAGWKEGDWNEDGWFDSSDLILAFQSGSYGAEPDEIRQQMWPDLISLPAGFEPKDIEMGQGNAFFVGATSWSSLLAPRVGLVHPVSGLAGAIYKGNLCSGAGQLLVPPNPDNLRPVLGLSYDARTDYLYAAVGDPTTPSQGIAVFNATTGEMIDEVTIGNDLFLSNVLVTESAVFATSTSRGALFKIPLEEGGKLPSTPAVESLEMTGYNPPERPWIWGLAGDFDGKQLVVIDGLNGTGELYRVNTANGTSTKIEIHGDQKTFELGDELYLSDRTLYIMQVFANSVAVVQLSDDMSQGTFIQTIQCGECRSPHSIAAFDDSIYAVSSNVLFDAEAPAEDRIFGDSSEIQSDVIKLPT